jgi:Predicted nucleotidyltransferases
MDEKLRARLAAAKLRYEPEGFTILGLFGSQARGDAGQDSDLDVLYRLEERFLARFPGWSAYARIEEIRADMELAFGMTIDVADVDALDDLGEKHILSEAVYVP